VFLLEAKGFTHKQTAERLQKEEPNVRRLFLKAKARLAALIKLDEEMDSL
jgi:DNA-directed RNA polymerase specialized sigma24 family protein